MSEQLVQYIQKCLIIAATALAINFFVINDSIANEKDDLLANFIYNLVNYISWEKNTDINICAYGNDGVSYTLAHIDTFRKSKLDTSPKIRRVSINTDITLENILSCNLVYIAESEEKNVLLVLDKVKNSQIITVSSLEDFITRGGILEFKVMRRKVHLKIGSEALKHTRITLSPVLLMSVRPDSNETTSP